ncbi:lipopolysaccharide biosynthesis protein [Chryseobacterium profundimaris]|uniref:Membrane protein involved in the export of O-antigen and teichoic acid n=1 Tax=Chryseobacterium profundimaris TaxID=1387275 RepID=A0ABY1NPG3_9FLAO|nr:hypothetical protein [Chryseobacterium profundimaris]SMP14788.1 Membrane protein involved in the export of O-antigen and teichoic acid [Chryseobacterium profundimaris]
MKNVFKLLQKHSFLVFTDQLIFSGSNFLLAFLLARKLSISDFGFFSSVLIVTYLLVAICNALIVQPFQILAAKKFGKKSLGFVFQAAMLLILIFSLLIFSATFLPLSVLEVFWHHIFSIILFVSAYILQDFLRKILLITDRIQLLLFIDSIFILVFPLIAIQENLSPGKSLMIIGLVNCTASVPGIWYIIRNSDLNIKNSSLWKYYWNAGKWLVSASILQWFSSNFFTLAAGMYLGISALGALRLVQSFFGVINVILQTVENYYIPKTAKLYYQDQELIRKKMFKNMVQWMVVMGIVIGLFFVFSQPLIALLGGEKYREYGFVVKLVSILYVIIIYSYPTRISIRVLEQNKAFFIGYCISFLFSIMSFHFLLQFGGLYGAVAGLAINQILMIAYWKILLNKKKISLWT